MKIQLKRTALSRRFEAFIELDSIDLDDLIEQLGRLKERKNDHFHLMSEDWGMEDIEVVKTRFGPELHHIKVMLKT
ncbi:MAG: hypothetical protein AAGK66_05370 [Pseudomonadota bacterium]